jgi:hypothetical protein
VVAGELVGEVVGELVGKGVGELVGGVDVGELVGEVVGERIVKGVGYLVREVVFGELVSEVAGELVGKSRRTGRLSGHWRTSWQRGRITGWRSGAFFPIKVRPVNCKLWSVLSNQSTTCQLQVGSTVERFSRNQKDFLFEPNIGLDTTRCIQAQVL